MRHSGRMQENNKLMPQSKSNRVPCQMCGVEFGKAKYLSQHMLIHEGKTFACSMCSKTFSSRIRLTDTNTSTPKKLLHVQFAMARF